MLKKLALIALFAPLALLPAEDKSLSLRQKIAQMMVVAVMADSAENQAFADSQPYNLTPEHALEMVEKEQVGGIIFLGPNRLEKMVELRNKLQEKSTKPLLFFLDAEWGLSMRVPEGVVTYPKAMTLGALSPDNDHMLQELGKEIGTQLKAIGIHSPLAPVCDVNNNPENPVINMRSFGQSPQKVAKKATLFMRGLENAETIACAKHFPGHGDVGKKGDTHHNIVTVPHDMQRLETTELEPFRIITKNKISAVMTAHLDVPALTHEPGESATFSKKATEYLRKTLKFKGLIITDGLGMTGAAKYDSATVTKKAIQAGADIALCPVDVTAGINAIVQAVAFHEIPNQEIDEHLARIEFEKNRVCTDQKIVLDPAKLINKKAVELKQRLYTQAITLVRNNGNKLPLKKNVVRLLTIGTDSSNTFAQELKKHGDVYQKTLAINSLEDEFLKSFESDFNDDYVVALHLESRSGMIEMSRDNSNQIPAFIEHINSLKNQATLVLFGNPYNLKHFPSYDAVIVAYEDEPEAQIAAAQTILGFHNPTGQLPVTASQDYPAGISLSYK